jgi:S-adenosylmethionine synthetase
LKRSNYTFTSESVSEGHPDKVCDRISDAILDMLLTEESHASVACETFTTTDRVVIGGEIGLADKGRLEDVMSRVEDTVRACVRDFGYEKMDFIGKH